MVYLGRSRVITSIAGISRGPLATHVVSRRQRARSGATLGSSSSGCDVVDCCDDVDGPFGEGDERSLDREADNKQGVEPDSPKQY